MKAKRPQKQNSLPPEFWLVTFITFVNAVTFTIIIPLLYPYAKEFGLSDFQVSLLLTAFAVSQFISTPILGRLSDHWGRKPLLVISLAGTVLANCLAAYAPFVLLFYLARFLDGITGGNASIARAVVSDVTTVEQRPKAFGIFGAMFALGFVVGPPLSYLAQQLPTIPGVTSLGMSFLVAAGIALIATLLTAFFLPETLSQPGSFQLSWRDFGLGRIFRSVFRPQLGKLFILSFLSGITFTIFTFAFQPFFLNVLNQDAQTLAIVFSVLGGLGLVSQFFLLDPLRKRLDLVPLLALAIMARGVAFLLIPTFPNIIAFFVILGFFGLINPFPLALLNALLSFNSEQGEQGEVLGLNESYLSLANAIGPVVSGLLVSVNYSIPFWITGVLTILTGWFAYGLKSSLESHPTSTS